MGDSNIALEIPLLVLSFYLFRYIGATCVNTRRVSRFKFDRLRSDDLRERPRQVGSLAGAAHLLNNNTGVLRGAQ